MKYYYGKKNETNLLSKERKRITTLWHCGKSQNAMRSETLSKKLPRFGIVSVCVCVCVTQNETNDTFSTLGIFEYFFLVCSNSVFKAIDECLV